jgi:hypothetical protein
MRLEPRFLGLGKYATELEFMIDGLATLWAIVGKPRIDPTE